MVQFRLLTPKIMFLLPKIDVCCKEKQSRLSFSNAGIRCNNTLNINHRFVRTDGNRWRKSVGGRRYFFTLGKNQLFKYFENFKALVVKQ